MYTIKEMCEMTENQIFERKSIRIEPKSLAEPIVAFANADGGIIVIGIDDKTCEIEGINDYPQKVNEFLRVPFDFCVPTVKVSFEKIDCIDRNGNPNQLLVLNVEQSPKVHANQADAVFYRVGDKSKKLSFEERVQLLYDKGDMLFENTLLIDSSIKDIDMDFVESHIKHIGYSKTPMEYLTEAKPFIVNGKISTAAILLFGKNPQKFYPRAQVRFIKYQGTQEKTGIHMNVIKDVIFDGTILQMLKKAIDFVGTQIKEYTKLEKGGLFNTVPEYPEFVWNEIIVNAVCHRDYSIKGTDIQIKMFDDKLVVESPGTLPGLVRINNMRNTHFSRNPKIAEFLRSYKYVKEFGEGIDRMFLELESVGLKDPKYELVAFMTRVTIENNVSSSKDANEGINEGINESERAILDIIDKDVHITIPLIAKETKFSEAKIERVIKELKEKKLLTRSGSNKTGYWIINKK